MKKNLFQLFFTFGVVLTFFISSGCSNNNNSKKAKDTKVVSDSEIHELKTDEMNARSGKEWPTMLPADFPKFEKGTIVTAQESNVVENTSVIIEISGVDGDDVKKYVKRLERAGYKKQAYTEDDEDMGGVLSKGDNNVTVSWDVEEKIFNISYQGDGK